MLLKKQKQTTVKAETVSLSLDPSIEALNTLFVLFLKIRLEK
jgi:hypothetical protein